MMKGISRKVFVLAGVVVLLGAFALLFFLLRDRTVRAPGNGTGDGAGNAHTGPSGGSVSIAGNVVEPISPGVMVPLDLTFTNPRDSDMSITEVTVVVHEVSAPNSDGTHSCPIGDFTVAQAPGDLRIALPAGATNSLSGLGLPPRMWPRMGMLDRPVNQDGCKGASLTLAYTASGTGEVR
jgi:hypothetical protein